MSCPEHGVVTAGMPWAKPGSQFTTDFAFSATWMVKGGLSKKKVAEFLQIDWETVGRLVDLVWRELEPDVKKRFDGLVGIGIDETSYRKGHSYITLVVNHDTNTVVWAHKGHGNEVLDLFFRELTLEQRERLARCGRRIVLWRKGTGSRSDSRPSLRSRIPTLPKSILASG